MWSDPQEANGVSRSVARGSVCVTFGPDITRRFCEINRLRMIIRSHEVPRSMSGVAVQHDGRLITVFSASNYCGASRAASECAPRPSFGHSASSAQSAAPRFYQGASATPAARCSSRRSSTTN